MYVCRSSTGLADSVTCTEGDLYGRCGTYPKTRPPSCTHCTNLPHGQCT